MGPDPGGKGDDFELPAQAPLILVIEDDPTQRLLSSSVLRSAGYEVLEAEDGPTGLELARQAKPALIVCDVMMPGLNGYQLVAALKLEAALSTIPVILLTAMTERAHVRTGMTAGADDYLSKPFRAAELRRAVAALLAKREVQRAQYDRDFEKKMRTALQAQQDALSLRYEKRLMQELNERWSAQDDTNLEVRYDNATVLLVDLFSSINHRFPLAQRFSATRRVYQAASDTLYLFGASRLVPAGNDLLAIFPDTGEAGAAHTGLLAVRAALGLQKIVNAAFHSVAPEPERGVVASPPVTIALYGGTVTLVHIKDPLHGGEGLTFASGEALDAVRALGAHARTESWQICCAKEVISGFSEWVVTGGAALVSRGDAMELVPVIELHALEQE
ncbi:MAG: response regulator [Polaromonas sp.]|nr:response regulator [Polaromonas sp.]